MLGVAQIERGAGWAMICCVACVVVNVVCLYLFVDVSKRDDGSTVSL